MLASFRLSCVRRIKQRALKHGPGACWRIEGRPYSTTKKLQLQRAFAATAPMPAPLRTFN